MGGFGNIVRLFNNEEFNDHTYSFSKANYYTNLRYPRDLDDMMARYSKEANKEKQVSDTLIRFNGHVFGSVIQDVLKVEGKPRFKFEKNYNNNIHHTTLFYKKQLGKYNTISQMHFIDDDFYWGVFLFLNKLSNNQLNDFKKALGIKYAIQYNDNSVIIDRMDNRILLSNEIHTSLNYISGNAQLRDRIIEKLRQHKYLISLMGDQEQNKLLDIL